MRRHRAVKPPVRSWTGAAAPASPGATDGPSVAVLPFADLSPAGDQEVFTDGLSEELLNALARVRGLRVAARTSSLDALDGLHEDPRWHAFLRKMNLPV